MLHRRRHRYHLVSYYDRRTVPVSLLSNHTAGEVLKTQVGRLQLLSSVLLQ